MSLWNLYTIVNVLGKEGCGFKHTCMTKIRIGTKVEIEMGKRG